MNLKRNNFRATAGLNFSQYFQGSKLDGTDLLISKLFSLLLHKEGLLRSYTNNFSTPLKVPEGGAYFDIYQEITRVGIFINLEDIKSLRTLDSNILAQDFSETFDIILVENCASVRGPLIMPLEVELFVKSIFINPVESLYVPHMHCADFCILGDSQLRYLGSSAFSKEIIISKLRLYAYEKYDFSFSEHLLQSNSLDAVCSFPSINPKEPVEFSFFEDNLDLLKKEGKMVLIMPFRFLFDRKYLEVRKGLIGHNLLESIIELPAGIFNGTGIKTTLLVISKDKDSSKIGYYDSSHFFEKVSKGRILDWAKVASYYSGGKPNFEIDLKNFNFGQNFDLFLPAKLIDYSGISLRELLIPIRFVGKSEAYLGKVINMDAFQRNPEQFEVSAHEIDKGAITPSMRKLDEPALIFAAQGSKILSKYFVHENEAIYLTAFSQAFKVNHQIVDYRYLILALKSQKVAEQMELHTKGSALPFRNILSLIIDVPSLEEQRIVVDNYLLQISKTEHLKESYMREIDNLSTLRHKIAGQVNGLPHVTSKITQIISEKIEPLFPGVLDLKLENSKYTLGEYLQFMKNDSENLKTMLTTQISKVIDFDAMERKPLEIIPFLKDYCEFANEKSYYEVKFEMSDEAELIQHSKIFIYGDADALRQMFDNLLDNAEKHAFKGASKNRVEIFLDVYMDSKELVILVSNTGEPFPVNFSFGDFIKKGIGAGSQHGDGVGGWLINQIVEKHDGRLDLINEQGSEGIGGDLTSSFEITLPLTENLDDESI